MKDEQIESILRDRFEPVRASKIPQPRRATLPRLATATAALAVITTLVVVYTGLGPNPAQAMQRANEALKGVQSFRVEGVTTRPNSDDSAKVVIVRSGTIVATDVDRDPISVVSVTQGNRNVYWPKGSKVAYSRTIGEEDIDVPLSNEEPLDFVFRTYWQPRTAPQPGEPQGSFFKKYWESKPVSEGGFKAIEFENGRALVRVRFAEDLGDVVNSSGISKRVIRKGSMTFEKETSRPTELQIEDVDPARNKPLWTTYRFSYDKDRVVNPVQFFPKGTEIVDLDAWGERQRREWLAKPPLSKGTSCVVADAFTSTDGWTMLVASGVFNPAPEAVDQAGNKWLVRNANMVEMMKFGFTNYLVFPLDPATAPTEPILTLTVNGAPLQVELPATSGKTIPNWMPLADGMNKVFKYSFIAESFRAQYYKEKEDVPNELRWHRAAAEKFKRFPGHMEIPSVRRIRELTATP